MREFIMSREYPVSLVFADTKTLLSLVDAISSLADDVYINISEEGLLKIIAIDPAKVSMIEVEFPQESFLEYKVQRPLRVGISTKNLSIAMEDVKRQNRVSLQADEENIEIMIEGIPRRRFLFRSLEMPSEEIPKLEIEYPGKASVQPDPFASALSDLTAIANYITFKLDPNMLELREADTQKRYVRLTRENGSLLESTVSEEVSADYDASYLSPISKLVKISTAVDVWLGSGIPLKLEMGLTPSGKIIYYLAPRA
jgi:DNA polymerase III sliding clamp (beta) subunit (PCNA family)